LTASLAVEPVAIGCAPEDLFEGLSRLDNPVMLDSSATDEQLGRFTILACHPLDVLTLREDKLSDSRGRPVATGGPQVWGALAQAFDVVRLDDPAAQCEYAPGWIGYIGYEVGRLIERLPSKAPRLTALPDLRLAFYDAILVYDAMNASWHIAKLIFNSPDALDCPGKPGNGAAALAQLCESSRDSNRASRGPKGRRGFSPPRRERDQCSLRPEGPIEAVPIGNISIGPLGLKKNAASRDFQPVQYAAAVGRCIDYIVAGDIFQVNMTQRFTLHDAPPATDIYRCLRRRNPAWFAAFMSFDADTDARVAGVSPARPGNDVPRHCAILSSSPELFLRVRGRHVITRPIKGTRPRTGDAATDQSAAADLLASPKDNAELAMIIDLMRNDLGRVCRFGTVAVTQPSTLETHPTVFHLVGTVEGTLRDDVTPAGLLRATFPGGSITGAPKIRAMEIIDELEPCARGPYTGCIGIVGVNGRCEWNIAIRTIICDGPDAYVHAGGGIVADSSPQAEYQETLDKARAMLEAIAVAAMDNG
jgi:para-aminobenzoate synthetase component 1